jgi:SAM-dependent methyltransferase
VLPAIYDRWQTTYGKDYSTLIFPRLLRCFRTFGIPATTLLDLACGTGTLALLLQQYHWRVRAVDASPGMVREARKKSERFHSSITVHRQDMRRLRIAARVNVCTCLFDSINHLSSQRELNATIGGVARVLNRNGWFIFDVNNETCYRTLWNGVQTIEHPNFTLRLENHFAPSTRRARSEVFLQWKGKTRRKYEHETVRELYFPPAVVRKSLERNGFTILESTDFNFSSVPGMGKLKTWWVAKKTD